MRRARLNYQVADSLGLFVRRLNDESRNGALVVVEGKRDARALVSLGFGGPLFTLSHGSSFSLLASVAEKYTKTILLLDLDTKGRILTKKAATVLQGKNLRFDLFFRRQLAVVSKGRIKHIEELTEFSDYVQDVLKH